jgi:hypothetical protein
MAEWSEGWLRRGISDWLGSNWRSTLLGILFLILTFPVIIAGAVLCIWESTRPTGVVLLSSGISMLGAAIALLLQSESKVVAREQQQTAGELAHLRQVVEAPKPARAPSDASVE